LSHQYDSGTFLNVNQNHSQITEIMVRSEIIELAMFATGIIDKQENKLAQEYIALEKFGKFDFKLRKSLGQIDFKSFTQCHRPVG
jgi:hypothetical protein